MWGLILLATVYVGLLLSLNTLTGISILDGGIGVALGLHICAHPAANVVNLLFFEHGTLQSFSGGSLGHWLALNLLVLLAGWMVVYIGIRHLVAESSLEGVHVKLHHSYTEPPSDLHIFVLSS